MGPRLVRRDYSARKFFIGSPLPSNLNPSVGGSGGASARRAGGLLCHVEFGGCEMGKHSEVPSSIHTQMRVLRGRGEYQYQ